jgi:MFS family permease
VLLKESIVAPRGVNRGAILPAALGTHLSIGSVYAWSVFNGPLTREIGVVAPSAADWALTSVLPVFSTAIVALGICAAVAGKWLEQVGPRCVGVLAACAWGGGLALGSLGGAQHSLPLLDLGYGALGGLGMGLGYVTPVSTLIRWFPDKRGMATGFAIGGFGGGALIATALNERLLAVFARAPELLSSSVDAVQLVTVAGKRMAQCAGNELREVVVATAQDVAAFPIADALIEGGVYLVGTGNTGAAGTFAALGAGYFGTMLAAAFAYRVPRPDWTGPSSSSSSTVASTTAAAAAAVTTTATTISNDPMITQRHVHIDTALRTPQFYCLWMNLCLNVTAGIGVIGVAKTMMTDIFATSMAPGVVDSTFAATFVLMISIFNMAGRLAWSTASDYIGRKNTFYVFFGLGIPLYLSLPFAAHWAAASGDVTVAPLVLFYTSSMLIFSCYGGGFATLAAFVGDLFGTRFVGGIHGRLLTAWSTAGVLGPVAIGYLRNSSINRAMHELAALVEPAAFEHAFGASVLELDALIAANTVSIARLMELVPEGTANPMATVYDTTMYSMAGLLALGLVSNSLIRPVAQKYLMKR